MKDVATRLLWNVPIWLSAAGVYVLCNRAPSAAAMLVPSLIIVANVVGYWEASRKP